MTDTAKTALTDFSAQLAALTERISPSIVEVRGRKGTLASGFAWRPGLFVTAAEALGGLDTVTVSASHHATEAKIVGRDPSTGIALLKAEGVEAPALSLAGPRGAKTGEIILALGRREQGVTARLGVVALAGGPWRSMRGGHIDSLIRLDIMLDGRGEGAAVVDSEGRGLGLALRGPRRSVLTIPSATIERIASRISEHGSVRPGYLGLGLHPVRIGASEDEGAMGLIVLGVAPGGPGASAGLLQGDIITAWNGEPVAGVRGLFRKLGPDSAGQTVELSFLRAGQPIQAKCLIGARPEA